MKYFTFVVSTLTFFFVFQEAFAQVQQKNTSESLNVNQVSKPLNEKDFWDKLEIVGTLLVPISIALFGHYYSNAWKKIEIKREKERFTFEQKIAQINAELEKKRFTFEQEIAQINAEREEKRDIFEHQIAQMNIKARQAELFSKYMGTLLSKDSQERTLGVKAISLALPEEAEALVKVLSESDPSQEVKDIAQESLKILRLENRVPNKYELEQLYRLYEGEKQPRNLVFQSRKSFRAELRHLRRLGLIENKPNQTIGGMLESGDLRDYVKLTQDGIDYIESREKYNLTNPRREKNSEFWTSDLLK